MKKATIYWTYQGRERKLVVITAKTDSALQMELNTFWCKRGISNPAKEGYRVA